MSSSLYSGKHRIPSNLREQWYKQELQSLEGEIFGWMKKHVKDSELMGNIKDQHQLMRGVQDGRVLCDMVNSYFPQAHVASHEKHFDERGKEITYYNLENIHFFLEFLRRIGIPNDCLFDETDLFEQRGDDVLKRDVLLAISLFIGYLDALKVTEWDKHRGQLVPLPGDVTYFAVANMNNAPLEDEETMRKVITLESVSTHGWTPLYTACWFCHVKIISYLLEKAGADVNQATSGFAGTWFPIHAVAYRGHSESLRLLLAMEPSGTKRSPCHVNVLSSEGTSPLCHAVKGGFTETCLALLRAGADVNLAGEEAWTPVHAAVRACNKELFDLLVERGAKLEATYHKKQYTPLHLAVAERHGFVEHVLSKGAKIDPLNHAGVTPLGLACIHGSERDAFALLEKGANIDVITHKGHSILELCVSNGHPELAEKLAKQTGRPMPGPAKCKPNAIHTIDYVIDPPKPQLLW